MEVLRRDAVNRKVSNTVSLDCRSHGEGEGRWRTIKARTIEAIVDLCDIWNVDGQ